MARPTLLRAFYLLGFAAFASSLSSACSSEDCAETRSCPGEEASGGGGQSGGGQGGEAASTGGGAPPDSDAGAPATSGAAGSSGEPAPACEGDGECDDGDPCNGAETCFDGACLPGVDPCAEQNGDPDHCETTCVPVGAGQIDCGVRAKDEDGDTWGNALCAIDESEGTADCDDGNPDVSPDALEACNGVDDDCDGKTDTDDGLAMGGVFDVFQGGEGDLIWSPPGEEFVSVMRGASNGYEQLFWLRIDRSGQLVEPPRSFVHFTETPRDYVRIVWGGDAFGVVWREGTSPRIIRMVLLNSDYSSRTPPLDISDEGQPVTPTLARMGTGSWTVGWNSGEATVFQPVTASGSFDPSLATTLNINRTNVVGTAAQLFIAGYATATTDTRVLFRAPIDMESRAPTIVSNNSRPGDAQYPHVIAASGNDVGVAYMERVGGKLSPATTTVRFAYVEGNGVLRCDQLVSSDEAENLWDIDAFDGGFVITTSKRLIRVDSNCKVVRSASHNYQGTERISTAVSPDGVVAIAAGSHLRVVGKNFCD